MGWEGLTGLKEPPEAHMGGGWGSTALRQPLFVIPGAPFYWSQFSLHDAGGGGGVIPSLHNPFCLPWGSFSPRPCPCRAPGRLPPFLCPKAVSVLFVALALLIGQWQAVLAHEGPGPALSARLGTPPSMPRRVFCVPHFWKVWFQVPPALVVQSSDFFFTET